MRTIYLNGADISEPALYNRILEFVDTSASYLYDPEGARFVVEYAQRNSQDFLEEEEAASDDFQTEWTRRYTLQAALMVEYAHVYPSTIAKVFANDGRVAFRPIEDPADVGVWREDLLSFEEQEVIVHHFRMDVPSFERWIAGQALTKEDRDSLIHAAREYAVRVAGGASSVLPPAQSRIILSAVSPNAIGAAQAAPIVSMATPESDAPVVELAELWVWDDDRGDWNVATLFRPTETVVADIGNPQPGIDAFYRLCIFPTAGYIWGLSPIERMIGLQMWRTKLMGNIDRLIDLNLDPPRAFLGISGMTDEKAKRLNTPGGHFTSTLPGGSIETLAPQLTPDAWTMLDWQDRMFNRMGGLPPGADVAAEMSGVRAGNQLESMADLGSPRMRKRAMYVEAFLNAVATAVERLRRRGAVRLVKPSSRQEFLLAQTPGDLTVSVAAHSASPLYAERMFERGLLVYDRGAIDDETLVVLSGLPMQSRLRAKARQIMQAKGERAKQAFGLEQQKIENDSAKASAAVRKSLKP